MFRRRDEEETNEYSLQTAAKIPSQPNAAANQQHSFTPSAFNQSSQQSHFNERVADEAAVTVPFIKAAASKEDAPKAEKPEVQAAPAAREVKVAKAANPAANANTSFTPSAAKSGPAAASANQNSIPSSVPAFLQSSPPKAPQQNFKVENIGVETERRLTVGYGISLEGRVSDCDKLVIYGRVNAELNNVKALQISESGTFSGAAEIEYADISGVFEGELKVRKNIVINSTGRVSGKITYGAIEIRPGGKFTGEIVEDKTLSEESKDDDQRAINISEGFSLFDDKNENKAA